MEDTLGGHRQSINNQKIIWGLNPCFNGRYSRSYGKKKSANSERCLNPCFNGRYSRRSCLTSRCQFGESLNPCFNGRYSRRRLTTISGKESTVLILVLMEDTLGEWESYLDGMAIQVLILVLMEDTLGDNQAMDRNIRQRNVLILVLMEDTLGG